MNGGRDETQVIVGPAGVIPAKVGHPFPCVVVDTVPPAVVYAKGSPCDERGGEDELFALEAGSADGVAWLVGRSSAKGRPKNESGDG